MTYPNADPEQYPPAETDDRDWRERYVRRVEARNEMAGTGMVICGIVLCIFGGIAWLATHSAAIVCSSGVIYALNSDCGTDTLVHTLGGVGFLIGVALAIGGAVIGGIARSR